MSKARQLRRLFEGESLIRIVGAHDGLSAKLVERNGFDGVWASGLEIATSYAVPDANILTMTQHLERVIQMNDAIDLPVVADCDTGFGNSNNVIHMVKRYEAAGVAAVCIEDKQFPKVNSFIPGRQDLATIAEFVGKIMAAKNAQITKDFMVIARVEALIAGWGQAEALKRANAYIEAGADAILIHSKLQSPQEIVEFVKKWENRVPLVIVPTTYTSITTKEIDDLDIKMVIYANHGVRAAVKAMDSVLSQINEAGTTHPVENQIAPMKEIFELQGMTRMKEDEQCYLRSSGEKVVAVIPAAGDHLEEYSMKTISSDIPIAMLDINGKPLLQRQYETLCKAGILDVCVVGGYKKELIDVEGVRVIENENYRDTGILNSIMCASSRMQDKALFVYGDILFDDLVLSRMIKSEEDITILVNKRSDSNARNVSRVVDYVISDSVPIASTRKLHDALLSGVKDIGKNVSASNAHYEFPGIIVLSSRGLGVFKDVYAKARERYEGQPFHSAPTFKKAGLADLLQEIVNSGYGVHCMEIESGWMEINSMEDYKFACSMVK